MDTQDREKYRQLRQQQRERQLHIIRLSILLGVGVILMFIGLGLLTYVHQQKQTATSGNVSERFSEAASSAALETASRNDLDTETAAATEKAQKKKKKQSQTTDVSETTPVSADDYLGLLQQQSADLPKLKRILKDPSRYPKSLLKALSKNSEMLDFVLDYPKKHKNAAAKSIGDDFVTGEIPALIQWDERWGYTKYGTSIVAVSGCGPTCMSMVVSGLTGNTKITPARTAAYSVRHNLIDEENNTYWEFMEKAAKHWGLNCYAGMLNKKQLKAELGKGHPVICSVGPGDFTKNGHFIVLSGWKDGKIQVNDPFSRQNSQKLWTYSRIKKQAKSMWVYSYSKKQVQER